jgi:hypothetical protein
LRLKRLEDFEKGRKWKLLIMNQQRKP